MNVDISFDNCDPSCVCGWLEKMRCRRRARVVLPLEEGPERAIIKVGMLLIVFFLNPALLGSVLSLSNVQ